LSYGLGPAGSIVVGVVANLPPDRRPGGRAALGDLDAGDRPTRAGVEVSSDLVGEALAVASHFGDMATTGVEPER